MNTMDIKILTANGWKTFKTVQKFDEKVEIFKLTTESGKSIKCSLDHGFVINGKEIKLHELEVGLSQVETVDGLELVTDIKTENVFEYVYDVVGVDSEHSDYFTSDILSHNCQFHGSSVTLINADFLVNKMKWKDPVLNPDDSTFIWSMPQPGRKYLVSIDTAGGVGSDFSVMNIFDITDFPYGKAIQCALWRNNTTRPPQFAEMVYHTALQWNNAYIIGEVNGLSAEVINRLIEDFEYENIFYDYEDDSYGVYSDKASKRHAAVWFKEELEQEHIEICDSFTITELGYFEEVTPGVYRAKAGRSLHDDCVITCLWLVYFLKSKYFEDIIDEWKLEAIKQKEVQDFVESEASESEQLDFEENLHSFIERDNEEYDENWLDREEN